MGKESVSRILHGQDGAPKLLGEFSQSIEAVSNILSISVEIHYQSIIFPHLLTVEQATTSLIIENTRYLGLKGPLLIFEVDHMDQFFHFSGRHEDIDGAFGRWSRVNQRIELHF